MPTVSPSLRDIVETVMHNRGREYRPGCVEACQKVAEVAEQRFLAKALSKIIDAYEIPINETRIWR